MPSLNLTPLAQLRVSSYLIPPYGPWPNGRPTARPLLIYHSAFPASCTVQSIHSHLLSTGVVEPAWTYPMYKTDHYHSTTHEILVVHRGSALLRFGGEANPDKVKVEVRKGDVMVIPAGYAHAMVRDTTDRREEGSGGFEMVGSYPVGADQWDHCTDAVGEDGEMRMKGLEWFERDPVYGDDGPVMHC